MGSEFTAAKQTWTPKLMCPLSNAGVARLGRMKLPCPTTQSFATGLFVAGAFATWKARHAATTNVTLPTPHDEAEKDFRFSICIDERDHLPEQTRRTPPGSNQERVSTYTHWDVGSEPQLPAGFPR